MAKPVVPGVAFAENQEVSNIHNEGLSLTTNKHATLSDLDRARFLFDDALTMLGDLPQTKEVTVQTARVYRDDGFTEVRQAIGHDLVHHLLQGESTIAMSEEITKQLLEEAVAVEAAGLPLLSGPQFKELYSEHGATLSLAARAQTVARWYFGLATPEPNNKYLEAHKSHLKGSNVYYRVNNAMAAARAERIQAHYSEFTVLLDSEENVETHFGQMFVWLGRASNGLIWGINHDPVHRNLLRAAGSSLIRAKHLLTGHLALDSLATMP